MTSGERTPQAVFLKAEPHATRPGNVRSPMVVRLGGELGGKKSRPHRLVHQPADAAWARPTPARPGFKVAFWTD